MNADERRFNEITEIVIACAYARQRKAQQQVPYTVRYRGAVIGEYCADLLVEGAILFEIKAVKSLDDVHMAQCMNYLKATGLRICLLINFAKPRIEIRRIVNNF